MANIFVDGDELITKNDVTLSNDLLQNAKWSKITYVGTGRQPANPLVSMLYVPSEMEVA